MFPLDATAGLFSNALGAPSAGPHTLTDGTITLVSGPSAPTLAFTPPAPGPVALTAGPINQQATGSIAVAATGGTAGTTVALACTGSAGFTATVTGSPFSGGGSGAVNIACTRGAADVPGTITCNQTPSVGAAPAASVFNTTCPAGIVAPGITASGGSLIGAPGTTATGGVSFLNTGTAPLTVTGCTTSAGFLVTGQPVSPIAPGATGAAGLSCTTPAAAGGSTAGTLTCVTNVPGSNPITVALSCSSQLLAVPAMGSFAKGMLAALLAGIGLLGFALRRKLV